VSDLDSDLEPDQLIPTYIKIKGKLFEIDPDVVDAKPRKQPKGNKGRQATQANPVRSPAVRKLLSQLQQLSSDALFDVVEAEAQWPVKRNEIAQMKAAQRLEQSTAPSAPEHLNGSVSGPVSKKVAEPPAMEADDASIENDDAALFGGMFSAVPDDPLPPDTANGSTSDNITLRDFGKQSGVSPRRVLEETVRARFVSSIQPVESN
jgi:ATP-dependent RNA helicase DHX29